MWAPLSGVMSMKLGEIIEELRLDRGLHQKDLGDFLNVSVATISHYETSTNMPDAITLSRIADYFGVSTDYLLNRTRLKMDWNTFKRPVKLSNGSSITADKVLITFLKLSDESQADILKLMDLYYLGDARRHSDNEKPLRAKRREDRMDKNEI